MFYMLIYTIFIHASAKHFTGSIIFTLRGTGLRLGCKEEDVVITVVSSTLAVASL